MSDPFLFLLAGVMYCWYSGVGLTVRELQISPACDLKAKNPKALNHKPSTPKPCTPNPKKSLKP